MQKKKPVRKGSTTARVAKKAASAKAKPAAKAPSSRVGAAKPAARPAAAKSRPVVNRAVEKKKPVPRKPEAAPVEPPEAAARPAGRKSSLKKAELAKFRELLLAKRENLVGDLRSMEAQAFRASGQDSSANHMADFGSDNYEQDFTLGLIENDQEVVRQIHEALARMDAGEYGICQDCAQEIPQARLEVLPWAEFCVKCQERNERL